MSLFGNLFSIIVPPEYENKELPHGSDLLMSAIKDNYSNEHLDKWHDVMKGKYFLSVSNDQFCHEIFRFNGIWYVNIERQGDGSQYFEIEEISKTLISLFLNPEVTIHVFDYEQIREQFIGKRWTLNGEIQQYKHTFYYNGDEMTYSTNYIGTVETHISMDPDDIGHFAIEWIHNKENYIFEDVK